jgi:hypothetical protein
MAYWLAASAKTPNMTLREDGVAVAVARASDPHYRIRCSSGWKCTLGAFGSVPIPSGTKPDPSDDGHLAIYDPVAHHEWDLWHATCCWGAVAGSAIATRRQSVAPRGTASADAANFPLLGGLIRPEEIARGLIAHPLVFGQPGIGPGPPICPATSNAPTSSNPLALREGTQLQLDPAVNVRKLQLPAWQKVIAKALQVYGMYLRDNSGTLAIYAENPLNRASDPWRALGLGGGSASFSPHFPWSRMRVLKAPRLRAGACPRPHKPGR